MADEQTLATIRERVRRGDYIISFTHTEKLRERKISAHDIERAICDGAIIEDYPDDPRGPSRLFSGGAVIDLFISCVVSFKTSVS